MSATSTVNTAYVPNAGLTPSNVDGDGNENIGMTVVDGENKFYYKAGKSVFLFNSEAERQSMLEWASSVSGVAIDDLEAKDVKGVVNKYELTTDWNTVSDLFTGDDGKETRAWMITVKTPIFDKIDTKISKDFFGGEAPFFSPGSEQYLKHRTFNFNGDPAVDGGQLAGLTGSAQFLFNKNYEGKTTTPTDLAALPDPVETLCKSLFGSDVAITQEHLNILKLMGLVTGDATKGVGDWALSTAGQTSSSKLAEKEPLKFIASMATLAMKPEDLVEASGASVFFKGDAYAPVADSNPAKNYAATDVESLAKKVYKNMEGTVETLPAGLGATTGQKDSILKLVTNLLNLPATTTWEQLTPSQINTAISMGLAAYNPTTNALTLTGNGATYISSKAAVPATAPPVTTAAAEQDTGLKAFWDALNTFYTTGGPLGADRAEVHRHDAGVKNDRFGTLGIGALGQASATDEDFWKDAELSHLNGDQRTQLINASNTLLKPEYGTYLAQVSTLNGGSGEANVFLTGQMNTWLVNNHGDWQGQGGAGSDDRATANFNNAAFAVPATFVFDATGLSMSAETTASIDAMSAKLFGKNFSAMTADEKKKAMYILTSSFNTFAYTPPVYAEVAGATADAKTTNRVITPGMVYTRPGIVVPGSVSPSELAVPEKVENQEAEDEEEYEENWYGNS
ncbi:hypothetical protein EV673_1779 [Limnobacter thiooxidans]|uniref:Uncharacterized protein n=1 Tax=Limnobacter thiooxidans TaxID=131080 RepID=A0AA86MFS8_9BURK|nr:hypothetical protein [Limnobacter sp.]MCZ8016144.1 hypothetical protein [Limnobacter sp.]RZS40022.1 hypothetical protein EV673_1779 [Limnobacter thiooxidans]BET27550.1 hypothetical protein RGQ30_30510 [Limnobacter thiooxidans]